MSQSDSQYAVVEKHMLFATGAVVMLVMMSRLVTPLMPSSWEIAAAGPVPPV